MTKSEFNALLRRRLHVCLPAEDVEKTLEYYNEMLDERMEAGADEAEAVAALGEIDRIVADTLTDTPMPRLIKHRVTSRPALRVWEIMLLILGSPVWLSLLAAVVAVVVSVYVVLWAVVVVFFAAVAALGAGALGGLAAAVLAWIKGAVVPGFFFLGAALVCAGLTVGMFIFSKLVAKGMLLLSKKLWLGIKLCFVGRRKDA